MTDVLSSNPSNALARLRKLEKFQWSQATDDCNASMSIRMGREVLAEIERLTRELAKPTNQRMRALISELTDMRVERDRLRAALEEYAECLCSSDGFVCGRCKALRGSEDTEDSPTLCSHGKAIWAGENCSVCGGPFGVIVPADTSTSPHEHFWRLEDRNRDLWACECGAKGTGFPVRAIENPPPGGVEYTGAVAGPKAINPTEEVGIKAEPAKSGLTTQTGLAESPNNRRIQALRHAETVMMIVEPRSHKAEYLECLAEIRAALAADEPAASR